jgi:hypothetical protein
VCAAAACSADDTSRAPEVRGSLGQELFGALCDRVGAQALHEDLTGASYQNVCHPVNGVFSNTVDVSLLPTQIVGQADASDDPSADRAAAVARIERLAAYRDGPLGLIAAFDATFPDESIAVKDLANADPTQSCNAAGQGSLHAELQNLLARFTPLYNDRTLPHASEAFASIVSAFAGSPDAQGSYAHFDSRAGYRPIDLAVGAGRPIISYPKLRELTNATLSLVSPDSTPYDPNARTDANGNRIPTPGAAHAQMAELVTVAQAELANETADPVPSPLVLASNHDATANRSVLNRPRTDLEVLQSILFAEDPTFAVGGPTASSPAYVTLRDPRGYAAVASVASALPAPFVAGPDGLPAVDALGAFMTTGPAVPPPFRTFEVAEAPSWTRDAFGRALSSGKPIYDTIDMHQTYLSTLLGHVRGAIGGTSLVDSNPANNHETLMNALAGAYVLLGTRSPNTTRTYANGTTVTYDAFPPSPSPLGDLVYALGQILADPSADPTLALASTLMAQNAPDMARLVGATIWSKDQANANTTAKIPATSTFWDELIANVIIPMAQDTSLGPSHNRLLEDILLAFAQPASQGLSKALASQAAYLDDISYDRTDVNGPVVNVTTKTSDPPKTPVVRTQPDATANRSDLQRFAQLVHDTNGVTMCNKEGALLHAVLSPALSANACASTAGNDGQLCLAPDTSCACGGGRPFHECEVFKIDNLATFYLDSIVGKASLYFRNKLVREGAGTGPGGIGAASVAVIEDSSGLGLDPACAPGATGGTCNADKYNDTPTNPTGPGAPGFWDPSPTVWNPTVTPPTLLRPKPAWIHRQVGFDLVGDSPTSAGPNYLTNHFLSDLQGTQIGTSVCPVRTIPDPCSGDPNCGTAADADVATGGMVSGLRSCASGDWLWQRDGDTLFLLEENGFLAALTPLANAFVSHGREDLFSGLMEVLHKHWQTAAGAAASPDECKLATNASGQTTTCAQDGADTYEPLLSTILGSDLLPALSHITSVAAGLRLPMCSVIDPVMHTCTTAGAPLSGIGVLAAATRALVDPAVAKSFKLTDSTGITTSLRNDGTTNPQVTPLYLLLEALNEVDAAFANDAQANPTATPSRQADWKSARSQLVDELFAVSNATAANQDAGSTSAEAFADPSLPKIAPVLIDTVRAQLLARCGSAETNGTCAWARGSVAAARAGTPVTALWNEMVGAIGRPTFAATLDLLDAIRSNAGGRAAEEDLLQYLASPTSTDAVNDVEALTELLTTAHDLFQVLPDDANLVPFYPVLAAGFAPTPAFAGGNGPGPTVIDATTALLSRVAGQAFDAHGHEICANELDPNGVLNVALANLVKPMPDATGTASVTPLEVMVDAIAAVNRTGASTSSPLATPLAPADYAAISSQVNEFLTDPERGLEQFYAIVRQGTETGTP